MRALSLRLNTVASLVEGKIIADIGCDHGLLAFSLLKSDPQKKLYLSDISYACTEKARLLFEKEGADLNAEFFVGDGLISIPSQPDTAAIAGMGGYEIIKIIKNSPFKCNCYVVQPMKNSDVLRQFLIDYGYNIVYDKCLLESGKYYDIIKAVKKSDNESPQLLTDVEIKYGKDNIKLLHEDFILLLKLKLKTLKKAILKIENQNELLTCQKNISEIELVLSRI